MGVLGRWTQAKHIFVTQRALSSPPCLSREGEEWFLTALAVLGCKNCGVTMHLWDIS